MRERDPTLAGTDREQERFLGEKPLSIIPVRLAHDYPTSLLKHLQASGNLTVTTQMQMKMAEKLYVAEGLSVDEVVKRVFPKSKSKGRKILNKWIVLFGWEEERQRLDFERYQRVSSKLRRKPNISARADRIAGSIEQVIEELLEQHAEGDVKLSAKDLQTLAVTIERTYGIRAKATGQEKAGPEQKVNVNVDVTHRHESFMRQIAAAVADATEKNPQLALNSNLIEVDTTSVEDAEFELLEED